MAADKLVNYEALEKDRYNQSRQDLSEKLKAVSETEIGRFGSLRQSLLGFVVNEKYEQGKDELTHYVEVRSVEYPQFGDRVEKFVKHAVELMHAIQTKRNFPGMSSLSLSKQQELNEKVLGHFEELKQTLKTIERSEKEIRLADHRSTAWVVQVFVHCIMLVMMVGFVLSLTHGLWYSADVVFEALVQDVCTKIEHLLGWTV